MLLRIDSNWFIGVKRNYQQYCDILWRPVFIVEGSLSVRREQLTEKTDNITQLRLESITYVTYGIQKDDLSVNRLVKQ